MRRRVLALTAAVIAWRSAAAQSVAPLAFSRTVLPNGLVVLVNEDHTAPIVAVDVWYHVGSKDERVGRSGIVHLCEHLMNQGSPNEPQPQKIFIQSIGGTSAHWAVTSEDITHFFATVPSNQLETMLWLESDRMAAPLTRTDSAHFAAAREVIKQEREQDREAPVFGWSPTLTVASLFPNGHPYGFDPVGVVADLDAATPAIVRSVCLPYYVPNNAVIAVSGDLVPARTITLIKKYFGGIKKGAPPPRVTIPAPLASPARVVYEDARARVPVLRIAWPTVGFSHADHVALNALASALSRDRVGRLSKALVYDLGLATRVTVNNVDFEQSGLFQIDVTPRGTTPLTRLEQAVDSVLGSLAEHPVTPAEVETFSRANAMLAVLTLQTRGARADTLAHGEVFAHDPVAYAKQVNRAATLDPKDVDRVARQYLTATRMVMSMVPAGKLDLVSKPELPYTNVTPPNGKARP